MKILDVYSSKGILIAQILNLTSPSGSMTLITISIGISMVCLPETWRFTVLADVGVGFAYCNHGERFAYGTSCSVEDGDGFVGSETGVRL